MIGIGIDTGGTCTDAVIYDTDAKEILAGVKSETTHEKLEIGIRESLTKLPKELVSRASYISLSTTLATNACVENKGGRVCLIFIGVPEKTLKENGWRYGFSNTEDMLFLDAEPEKGIEPDWDAFEEMIPEILKSYDSVAVSQVMAMENNGEYEREVRERILAQKEITVVCAYEIFRELNVIKRGAGAFLNARLIPVIEEFFDAVHNVLLELEIPLPFLIMRSDGSLVSEQYAKNYPVETLLCGPTASVKGAAELMSAQQAVVIDMGGTTSDVALVKDGMPKIEWEGVRVGGWQTFVRGIEIDTFALGGDSRVEYHNQDIFLGNRRVLPVSALADRYPQVLGELERVEKLDRGNTKPLYEHLLLMKSVQGKESYYTDEEIRICQLLEEGPLGIFQLADRLGIDVYQLDTGRLEQEGILLRSGFTPTDAMVIKGDRTDLPNLDTAKRAALLAQAFLAKSTRRDAEDIPEEVYRLVKEKLFCNFVRILWKDAHARRKAGTMEENLEELAREAFARETGPKDIAFYQAAFSTDAEVLGVGAPIHVFVEDVAKALHTVSRVSPYSGVSNALGALLGDACVYETIQVRVQYGISLWDEEDEQYMVYGDKKEFFPTVEEAVDYAKELAGQRAEKKVIECGANEITSVTFETREREFPVYSGTMLQGVDVTACARGRLL
ncbi:MAG: hydantoinase/oxoprolinase family protein [Lachnospiraceae bacterium]|nr:hydantoinase/oxoprolinase family protein [Lachnospiraceae bacterium]